MQRDMIIITAIKLTTGDKAKSKSMAFKWYCGAHSMSRIIDRIILPSESHINISNA